MLVNSLPQANGTSLPGAFSRNLVVIAAIMTIMACGSIGATPIGKLVDNPRDFDGKTVSVRGKVTEVFSIFIVKYFVLKDSSGEITVVTDRPLPRVGQELKVKGKLEAGFSLADKQLVVLIELSNTKN